MKNIAFTLQRIRSPSALLAFEASHVWCWITWLFGVFLLTSYALTGSMLLLAEPWMLPQNVWFFKLNCELAFHCVSSDTLPEDFDAYRAQQVQLVAWWQQTGPKRTLSNAQLDLRKKIITAISLIKNPAEVLEMSPVKIDRLWCRATVICVQREMV